MAHVAKYSKGAMGHMMAHYDRSKDCGDNVDKERTHLNYNEAAHQQLTQLEFIHKRLSEVQVHNRKDVNVMCDWVVTAPKDFLAEHPDREREFFDSAYRFLEAKYGKENVISAHVHKDEVTPHMHFAFVPVVYDKKKDCYKLSAKECVTRADLRKFHSELQQHVSEELGIQVNIENGATKEGNLTIPQLRAQQERADSLAEQSSEAQKQLEAVSEELGKVKTALEALQAEIKPTEAAVADLRDMDELADRAGKTLTGKVVRSKKDDDVLRRAAAHGATVDHHLRTAQDKLHSAEHMLANERSMGEQLRGDIKHLKAQVGELKGKIEELTKTTALMDQFTREMMIKRQWDEFVKQKQREYEKQLRQEAAAERRQEREIRREMSR